MIESKNDLSKTGRLNSHEISAILKEYYWFFYFFRMINLVMKQAFLG